MFSISSFLARLANRDSVPVNSAELEGLRGQLAAIYRSEALIEFELDGTIVTANENFLTLLGYSLDDIKGKPHRLLVDSAQAAGQNYDALWMKLRRGECESGQYCMKGKDGREVWLQTTYTPVLDRNGKPLKVMQLCTDITTRKMDAIDYEGKLKAVDKVQAILEFELDGTIRTANRRLLDIMGYSLDEIRGKHHRLFVDPEYAKSSDYESFWARLRRGEIDTAENRRLNSEGKEVWLHASYIPIFDSSGRPVRVIEFASDVTREKQTTARLSELVNRIQIAASEVSSSAKDIADGNTSLSQRVEEQAASLEQTASSMEELTATVKQNADNASEARQLAGAARDSAEKGGVVVKQAVDAMQAISLSSRKIADIIGVIDEIAFQTNLLALNAAVEAARAGEQGRGFAVVASEVRNLAGRSASAAKEIKSLIEDSGAKVSGGASLVAQSGDSLLEIISSVKKVADIVAEIAAASVEQSGGIDQIARAVAQMNEMTQQNAALVEEASAASESILEQARDLVDAVGGGGDGQTRQPASHAAPAASSRKVPLQVIHNERRTSQAARPAPPKRMSSGGGESEWTEF